MRPSGDYRPARVMKLAALRRLAAEQDVEIVIDDDHDVVRALEQAGFAVLLASWAPSSRGQGRALRRAQEKEGRT
jgi:beta-phosphoglucomutase-like phosphatase (HAD superfamily)